jgi:hypothetical protein
MARETTYKGMLGDWEQLNNMLSENSAEVPHLEGSRLKLEELLKEGLELAAKQAMLRAEKQEASQRIKAVLANGQLLVTVLRRAVRQHYGVRAEKLIAYGVQPFRGRKAKPAPEEPAKPAASPAEPPPADPVR